MIDHYALSHSVSHAVIFSFLSYNFIHFIYSFSHSICCHSILHTLACTICYLYDMQQQQHHVFIHFTFIVAKVIQFVYNNCSKIFMSWLPQSRYCIVLQIMKEKDTTCACIFFLLLRTKYCWKYSLKKLKIFIQFPLLCFLLLLLFSLESFFAVFLAFVFLVFLLLKISCVNAFCMQLKLRHRKNNYVRIVSQLCSDICHTGWAHSCTQNNNDMCQETNRNIPYWGAQL